MQMSIKQGGDSVVTTANAERALAENIRVRHYVGAIRSVREGIWVLVTAALATVMIACLLFARDLSAWVWLDFVVVAASAIIGARRRAAISVRPRGFRGLYVASFLWLELVLAFFLWLFKIADPSFAVGFWPLPITLVAVGPYAVLGVWLIVRSSDR